MSNALKYIISSVCWLFLICSSVCAANYQIELPQNRYPRQATIIESFRSSFGFNLWEGEDSLGLESDSLLLELESDEQYNAYFELSRVVIKSLVLKGETRIAVARSELMYSKAKALNHSLGLALSLNALGEVYVGMGKDKEAINAYEQALEIMDELKVEEALRKILLVELVAYYLRNDDVDLMKKYMQRLNSYPIVQTDTPERSVLHLFNAYYKTCVNDLKGAEAHLEQVTESITDTFPGINQYFQLTRAFYFDKSGELEKSLDTYDQFLESEYAQKNNALYVAMMKRKADLLVRMGRKEDAFKQYYVVYAHINSVFKENYPKEIDQLCTRFHADRLAYQNEQDRNASLRYYIIAVISSVLLLLVFIVLGWRKIYCLNQSRKRSEKMKQKAENAIRKKNLFLSNMGHEVRTPLNAIVGFSTLLSSEEMELDEASRKEFCDIIKVNSYQLLKLINDILDFSDFEEDNIQMNIREHDVVKIGHEVIETIAISHKLQVELRFETDLPVLMVETDDARLRQVLINLLVNATKFTEKGSIILNLKRDDRDASMALFSVSDTGCGIPFEKQKLIFERFEKLNEFVSGTGLGLSICMLIMKRLNGKLWVDETYTQGARFCFTHPLKHASDKKQVVS